MKLLHAEDGGLVMYVKRQEEGTFHMPPYDENTHSYSMVMMVEGIRESPELRLKRLKATRNSK